MNEREPEAMIERLKRRNAGSVHPRVMMTPRRLERIRETTRGDGRVRGWFENLKERGAALLGAKASEYSIPDGKRLLRTSRRVRARVEDLGLLYLLTGRAAYARRAWEELEAAAAFPDWNPSHFLDTAEMTAAFAVGYDWLFGEWTHRQRSVLREAILDKGLGPGLEGYRGTTPQFFVHATHNWNVVCNGGLAMGALAIGDEEEAVAGEVLSCGLESLERMMPEFAPDGGWSEGPGYWHYTVRFLVNYLDALDTALGTDYGLLETPGLERTCYFPIHMSGTEGVFNFHDCRGGYIDAPELFWFAGRYGDSNLTAYRLRSMEVRGTGGSMRDILWFHPGDGTCGPKLPRGAHFRHVEAASLRSGWFDPQATYLGFHAGDNSVNHGNLDIGTFILDARGERWFTDLGGDNYNLPGYFGDRRWEYYRMRAEGHNTLVVDPGPGPDQQPGAFCRITGFERSGGGGVAVADMTASCGFKVEDLRRGVRLYGSGDRVLIQDELRAREPVEVWWFAHTAAQVAIEDGGRSAVLEKNGKRLLVLLQEGEAVFQVLEARPLPSSPDPEGQADNEGIRKLALHLEGVERLRLAVQFTPLDGEGMESVEVPEPVPLADWVTDD